MLMRKYIPILALALSIISARVHAEDKVFLACDGNITEEGSIFQNSNKTEKKASNKPVHTEIIIEKSNSKISTQYGQMNVCNGDCKCIFDENYYSCNQDFEVHLNLSPSSKHDEIWKTGIKIGRRSGIAVFTRLQSITHTDDRSANQEVTSTEGSLNCKVLNKVIF